MGGGGDSLHAWCSHEINWSLRFDWKSSDRWWSWKHALRKQLEKFPDPPKPHLPLFFVRFYFPFFLLRFVLGLRFRSVYFSLQYWSERRTLLNFHSKSLGSYFLIMKDCPTTGGGTLVIYSDPLPANQTPYEDMPLADLIFGQRISRIWRRGFEISFWSTLNGEKIWIPNRREKTCDQDLRPFHWMFYSSVQTIQWCI